MDTLPRCHPLIQVLVLLLGFVWPFATGADGLFSAFGEKTGSPHSLRAVLEQDGNAGPYAAELRHLYETRAFQPLWSSHGEPKPQTQALVAVLANADTHGLNPADYDAPRLRDWLARAAGATPPSETEWDTFDIALSRALMRLADHLHRGRIDPAALLKLHMDIPAKAPLDMPRLLEEWSKAAEPAQALARLEPATSVYGALKAALARYRDMANHSPAMTPVAPSKKSLRPGETRDSVPALRGLLQAQGYLAAGSPPADPALYDEALAEAVRDFQAEHGLEPDGAVGGQTLIQLNKTPAERLAQIRLALERLRWLPQHGEAPYLIINVPSFRLYGFAAGAPDLAKPETAMNVIVGQAAGAHNTPVFHADLLYVVFRPYWNVPYSITRKELLPLIERHDDYLDKNDMEIVASYGAGMDEAFDASKEHIDALYSGKLRLRQRPGPKNALGLIKFVFPNMNSVYLHSTPQQRLFQRVRRDFSHGCIRVADPVGLAEFVLKKDGGWDKQRIESAMQGDKSFTVRLGDAIPVIIFYTTALADEQGQVQFFPDIYEQDAQLLKLLDQPDPTLVAALSRKP